MSAHLVVAAATNDVIGRDGDLPWSHPADLKRFAALTRGGVVVMGRLTHESILARLGRPLPGRRSVVVTRTGLDDVPEPVTVVGSPEEAARVAVKLAADLGQEHWFVIGGAQLYAALLPEVTRIELTRVQAEVEGDARLPEGWLDGFTQVSDEDGPPGQDADGRPQAISFQRWERG